MNVSIGSFAVQPVGLSVGLGVLASFYLFRTRAVREGLSPQASAVLHLGATLGAVLGSRLPAASEGKLFDPPSEWILSPTFALLGALLAIEYLRMRMRLDRGAVFDSLALAAMPLLALVGLALALEGHTYEFLPCLLPLTSMALFALPFRKPGLFGADALFTLAVGSIARGVLGGPAAEVFGVAEPYALAGVALVGAAVVAVGVFRS